MEQDEKRGPGRPRKDSHPKRRRKTGPNIYGKRLPVDLSQCDFDNFKYRWINDDEVRLYAMTKQDDWNICAKDGTEIDGSDLGNAKSQIVGVKADGSAKRAFLCRKPKTFYEEDQIEKQTELDKQLEQLRRGNARDGSSQGDYVPSGGISISR